MNLLVKNQRKGALSEKGFIVNTGEQPLLGS
jgi:hypothetical protein